MEEEQGENVESLGEMAEQEFPGHGQWISELIEPFRHVGRALQLQLPAPDLKSVATSEILWRRPTAVVILTQYQPATCRFSYFSLGEDLLKAISLGLITKNEGLIEKTINVVHEVLRHYEQAETEMARRAALFLGLPRNAELDWVINRSIVEPILLRNVLKLIMATILSRLSNNPAYDCTLVLKRWLQGNFLLGFIERNGQAVYLCGPAANPKKY